MTRWYVQPLEPDAPAWLAIVWQRVGTDFDPQRRRLALMAMDLPDTARPPLPPGVERASMTRSTSANTTRHTAEDLLRHVKAAFK